MNTIPNTQTELQQKMIIEPYIRSGTKGVKSDTNETIGTTLALATSSHEPVYVYDKSGAFIGLASPYRAYYLHRRPYTTKLSSIVVSARHLRPTDHVSEAAAAILESGFYALPVFDSENVPIGVVELRDIAEAIMSREDVAHELASRVNPQQVVTASYHSTVEQVRQMMRDRQTSRVVLVDEEGRMMGIVSRQDLLDAYMKPTEKQRFHKDRNPQTNWAFDQEKSYRNDTPVRTFVTRRVNSMVAGSDPIKIVQTLLHSRHGSIVLVDKNRPVSILSLRDIAHALAMLGPTTDSELIMMNPSASVPETEVRLAREELKRFEKKMKRRVDIAKVEVHFEEPKYQTGTTALFNTTIIVTPTAGAKLVAHSKSKIFLEGIKRGIAQLKKQQRRSGVSHHQSAHHRAH